jgi:hypothetical protein
MTESKETRASRYERERLQREAERKELARREARQWLGIGVVLLAIVASGLCFYLAILGSNAVDAGRWGNLGSAVGPFVALLTVGALLSALWSVHLQRVELRETREEMFEQRMQFERTAEAQEALAKSQAAAARAQIVANNIALENAPRLLAAEHAQRMSNVASLLAAEASMLTSLAAARVHVDLDVKPQQLMDVLRELENQREHESQLIAGIEQSLADLGNSDEETKNA